MKTNAIRIVVLVTMASIVASCSTMKINFSDQKMEKVHSITLVSTLIGKIQQPVLPLIDAAAFNDKTNSIADQIMNLQGQKVDDCRQVVASSLERNCHCKVICGDSLFRKAVFSELKNRFDFKDALQTNKKRYPYITIAHGDINPFQFEKGNVTKYFNEPNNYKSTMVELSKKLDTDLIAVSYSELRVVNAGMFGLFGSLRIDTYLYLFNREGFLVASGYTWSKPKNISGKKIEDYQWHLDNLSVVVEPMIVKMIQGITTRQSL